eukprot:6612753-Karenia_brevis.AAC.1
MPSITFTISCADGAGVVGECCAAPSPTIRVLCGDGDNGSSFRLGAATDCTGNAAEPPSPCC